MPTTINLPMLIEVLYGTNRSPIAEDGEATSYSGKRDASIHYGTAAIRNPKLRKYGSMGSNMLRRFANTTDDHLTVTKIDPLDEVIFWRHVRVTLSQTSGEVLVYIHGYNVTFDQAAIGAAQLGYDLRLKGAIAFFSWPSRGTVKGYSADEATIAVSEKLLADFLVKLSRERCVKKVHILAHCMGCRGLLGALHRMARHTQPKDLDFRFSQIVLAAADIDIDVFIDRAYILPLMSDRTTLYVSPIDKALEASKLLHGYPRVGLTPPVTVVEDIETVEVTNFDLDQALGY